MNKSLKLPYLLAGLFLILGLGIHLYFQSHIFNIDELNSILRSHPDLSLSEVFFNQRRNHPFGYFLLTWISSKIFGFNEFALRLPGLLAMTLLSSLLYKKLIHIYKDKLTLIITLLIIAVFPMFTQLGSYIRAYSFFPLLGYLVLNATIVLEKEFNLKNGLKFLVWAVIATVFNYYGFFFVAASMLLIARKQPKIATTLIPLFIGFGVVGFALDANRFITTLTEIKGLHWLTPLYTIKFLPTFVVKNFFLKSYPFTVVVAGGLTYLFLKFKHKFNLIKSPLIHHFGIFSAVLLVFGLMVKFIYRAEILYFYSPFILLFIFKLISYADHKLKVSFLSLLIIASGYHYQSHAYFSETHYAPHDEFKLMIFPYQQALKADKKPPLVIMTGVLRCQYFDIYAQLKSQTDNNFVCIPPSNGIPFPSYQEKYFKMIDQKISELRPKHTIVFRMNGFSSHEMLIMENIIKRFNKQIEFQKGFAYYKLFIIKNKYE